MQISLVFPIYLMTSSKAFIIKSVLTPTNKQEESPKIWHLRAQVGLFHI
jgi:hypothetical protein